MKAPPSIADAVTRALPSAVGRGSGGLVVDMDELRAELEMVAREAERARAAGIGLAQAVRDPLFPALATFHQGLRDALLLELPKPLRGWVEDLGSTAPTGLAELADRLVDLAQPGDGMAADTAGPQHALAELLVFEAVRLRLLIAAWSSPDFEALGGDEHDVDAIAWEEIMAILPNPALHHPDVRGLPLMFASASVALARDASERVEDLRNVGEDMRERLRMRARLRTALRELRLAESVLLENALASVLGEDRSELTDLQAARPVALDGMSRQAMDQRVSRSRRALSQGGDGGPRRREPALFDLLRSSPPE